MIELNSSLKTRTDKNGVGGITAEETGPEKNQAAVSQIAMWKSFKMKPLKLASLALKKKPIEAYPENF